MAALPMVRVALLLAFSVFLTLVLGFGLPSVLNLFARCCGFPEASVTESIVLLYALFVLYVAMPRLPRGTLKVAGKAVLVTGCDTGFGLALAKHFHKLGFMVFAGCLFKNYCELVRSLWAVVNNAGISTFGEVEFTTMDTYKQVSEVNLWGTIRVTKAFLPLIRRAKGRVVNIASMYGRMGNALRSPYCVSKYGVEAFSDCLRYEMKVWNVKVSVIEPGNFIVATGILTRDIVTTTAEKLWKEAPPGVQEDYGKAHFEQYMALMRSYCNSGQREIEPVLDDVTDAITSKRPYKRYNPMEPHWWIRMQIMTHLPAAISDRLYF
ncbi:D-beta-hydroxybutyrate dehydrogenase, mitochondrial [Sinocyclocheilus grahami]|uniref:D-beta-hydroxybutyrate dehydrogenase, mitochondrial n=1 Tax=Sinocyclocheilus grahami TaxID=75366 RepID=UPI0007ACDE3C|nr:PREDICTED: D-beta-hydroxybutyrate dehydrogenase, mitochondrial [Sinocyclocheilus grahami]